MSEGPNAATSQPREPSELLVAFERTRATLWRQRAFLFWSLALCWGVVLAAHLLLPRRYVCEMTLRLPEPPWPSAKEPARGLSPGAFKMLQRSLANTHTLTAYMPDLSRDEVIQLRDVDGVVQPIASGSRNELNRIVAGDTMVAARIVISGRSEERLLKLAGGYAEMLRDAEVMFVARERLESQILEAETLLAKAWSDYRQRAIAEQNYAMLVQQLEAAVKGAPETEVRQVVDVQGGGHLYLTGAAQLRGVRARRAEDAYGMRVSLAEARFQETRLTLYRRLAQRLDAEAQKSGSAAVPGTVALVERETSAFLEGLAANPDERYNEVLLGGLARALRGFAAGLSAVQQPQIAVVRRSTQVALALIAATALMLAAAFVRDRG